MTNFEHKIKALATKVIMVASINRNLHEPDWAVYVDAVPGKRHEDEWVDVIDWGTKLSVRDAEHFFPEFTKLRYRL